MSDESLDRAVRTFGVAMTNENSERNALAAVRRLWEAELLSEETIGLASTCKQFEDMHPLTLKEGVEALLEAAKQDAARV